MTDKMLKFVKIGKQNPPKRDIKNRKSDFNEIYDQFIKNTLIYSRQFINLLDN